MEIKVTVYMPCYNCAQYVEQAINSVLEQKFEDWELIVINDGSTDNTSDIIKKFEIHPKIKIINQLNRGLTVTNNIAIRLAQGEYVIRLDADDWLDENALLVMANYLDKHPGIGLVYPDYYCVSEKGEILTLERRKKIGSEVELLDLPAHGACTMVRKECLLELNGYNEDVKCQDGYDLWIRFIERFEVNNINLPLFYYRQHRKNLTKNGKMILETRARIKRKWVLERYKNKPLNVLAIIPIRSISPLGDDLSFRKLGGKHLIDYTLEPLRGYQRITKLVVTSDSKKVLSYSKEKIKKAQIIERPTELAQLNTKLEPVISHVLQILKSREDYKPDVVIVLPITSPLRRRVHIDKALDTLIIYNCDSVISLYQNLNSHYQHSKYGLKHIGNTDGLKLEKDAIYTSNGAILLSKTEVITERSFLGKKVGHILMLPEESFQIDTEFDFWITEQILRRNKTKG